MPKLEDEDYEEEEYEGSSGEEEEEEDGDEGEEGGDEDEEDEDEEEEDDEDREPTPPPQPRVMPNRMTRGKRMAAAVADAEDADEQFWNQPFFAEEENDNDYAASSDSEDEVDSDFDNPENEDQADDDEGGDGDEDDRPKRKALKPPGRKAQPPKKKPAAGKGATPSAAKQVTFAGRARVQGTVSDEDDEEEVEVKDEDGEGDPYAEDHKSRKPRLASMLLERPSLRTSTVRRSEDAKAVREQRARKARPRQKREGAPMLTQGEMLAEAALVEIENLRQLEKLLAREEAVKKKAEVVKEKYAGPTFRYISSARERDGALLLALQHFEETPEEVAPAKAPEYPPRELCVVTGLPARYRDPLTALGYSDGAAFKALRQRVGEMQRRHLGMPLEGLVGKVRDSFASNRLLRASGQQQQPGQPLNPLTQQLRGELGQQQPSTSEPPAPLAPPAPLNPLIPSAMPPGPPPALALFPSGPGAPPPPPLGGNPLLFPPPGLPVPPPAPGQH